MDRRKFLQGSGAILLGSCIGKIATADDHSDVIKLEDFYQYEVHQTFNLSSYYDIGYLEGFENIEQEGDVVLSLVINSEMWKFRTTPENKIWNDNVKEFSFTFNGQPVRHGCDLPRERGYDITIPLQDCTLTLKNLKLVEILRADLDLNSGEIVWGPELELVDNHWGKNA